MPATSDNAALRRLVYGVLFAVTLGLVVARIMAATRVYEPAQFRDESRPGDWRPLWPGKRPTPMPTFSSNDRSRWATVRALVDGWTLDGKTVYQGTYVVARRDLQTVLVAEVTAVGCTQPLEAAVLMEAGYFTRIGSDRGIIFEDGWQTIDRVLHPDKLEFYSSKPPLLATLVAGLYWLLQLLTGWTLAKQPAEVVRTLLIPLNALPFLAYLYVFSRLVEKYGRTDWGRIFVVAGAAFATLVTPFLISLNNHTMGTFSVLFALASTLAIWEKIKKGERGSWYHFLLAGFFAAFASTNELPALSFACALFALLLWWSPGRTLLLFLPAAGVVAAAFFLTNYLAVGQFRPAYSEFGGPWYEYEGSHWRKPAEGQKPRHGIDWARYYETRPEYAMHFLVGHHGFFSLTPIWVLALLGAFSGLGQLRRRRRPAAPGPAGESPSSGAISLPWFLPALTLVVTIVVIGFYLGKSDNYSGWAVGLRWLIWLSPLLLLNLLPVADWLASRRWGRGLALVLLAWSAFSAHYPGWNPWRHPWLYDLLEWINGQAFY